MDKDLSKMTLEQLWQLFPIILKEYSEEYPMWYLEEKENILFTVGNKNIERINHIGSTSVYGLISKPIIDILLEINKNCNVNDLNNKLIKDGWLCMRNKGNEDLDIVYNKGYTPNGFEKKIFHLHVRHLGNWNELYFRDYLIKYKDIALKYGELKLSLIDKFRNNRDGYTEAKTDFISFYTNKAKEEFKNKYKP